MTVESPGQLPGLVRPNNMREMHFSRNPKIIEFLHVYEYVKEFGEGVDRMYREMEDAELTDPAYHVSSFMLCATLKNQKWVATHQQSGQVAPMIPLMIPLMMPTMIPLMMKLRSKIKY